MADTVDPPSDQGNTAMSNERGGELFNPVPARSARTGLPRRVVKRHGGDRMDKRFDRGDLCGARGRA